MVVMRSHLLSLGLGIPSVAVCYKGYDLPWHILSILLIKIDQERKKAAVQGIQHSPLPPLTQGRKPPTSSTRAAKGRVRSGVFYRPYLGGATIPRRTVGLSLSVRADKVGAPKLSRDVHI